MAIAVSNSVSVPAINSGNGTLTDEYLNGLIQGGSWQFGGGPRVLTYSFNINDRVDEFGNPIPGPGGAWTASQIDAVNRAFAEWSNVANISFQNISSGTYYFQSNADMAFTLTGNDLQQFLGAVALGFFPDNLHAPEFSALAGFTIAEYPKPEGDVFFDNFYEGFQFLNAGGVGFDIILHEIGHALGLKHPDDDGANSRPTFAALGISDYDSERWTIMSGNTAAGSTLSGGNPATPMPLDVLAMQQIYGANMSYHAGDDVYTNLYSFGALKTLWDAGGTDTIDISTPVGAAPGSSTGITIDLRPGIGYVDFPSGSSLTAIAFGVAIENANGTYLNDTLIGNDVDNTLDGRNGRDSLSGGRGNDTYVVSDIDDVVSENPVEGIDTVIIKGSFQYALSANVENLMLDEAASTSGGKGNSANNTITGNSADNLLSGGGGADTLVGGLGEDVYVIDNSSVSVLEGAGADRDTVLASISYELSSNLENLTLKGNLNLNAVGNSANNVLFGNSGNNLLDGRSGADTLSGGQGDDIYVVDNVLDVINEMQSIPRLVSTGTGEDSHSRGVISDDGTLVAFDIVAGGFGSYVRHLDTGELTLGSSDSAGNRAAGLGFEISGDGHYLAFNSWTPSVVAGDTNAAGDVFLKDLRTGATTRVSTTSSGAQLDRDSSVTDISVDGRYIVFASTATNLGVGDKFFSDLFLKDLQTGVVKLVSSNSSGVSGNYISGGGELSANGRYVVFESYADNLVPSDNNGLSDVFRKDLLTGATVLVSSSSSGILAGSTDIPLSERFEKGSHHGGISPDGRYVIFTSFSSNLVAGDTSLTQDIYLKDLETGLTRLISRDSWIGNLSSDGRFVVYQNNSADSNLSGTWVMQLDSGLATRIFLAPGSAATGGFAFEPAISADGHYIVGASGMPDVAEGDFNAGFYDFDIYVIENPLFDPGGSDEVRSSVSYTLPQHVELLILTGNASTSGTGNVLNNTLQGNDAGNVLNGGDGDDVLRGGAGNDSLFGGIGIDTADYSGATGGTVVELWRAQADNDGQGGVDVLVAIENLTGSAFSDTLAGDNNNNLFKGSTGFDAFYGGGGIDTADYSSAASSVVAELWRSFASNDGQGGSDTLVSIENLVGSAFSDTLAGDNNNNVFIGGAGFDAFYGGGGIDTADYNNASSSVIVELWRFLASNDGQGASDSLVSIENVVGSVFNDTLAGDNNNNAFKSGAGFDAVYGGGGVDTANYSGATSGVSVNLASQSASNDGQGGADALVDIENVIGSVFNDMVRGNNFANALSGNDGADMLQGDGGNDTLDGGNGIDTADFSGAASGVVAELWRLLASNDGQGGSDTLANMENLIGSAFNDTLAGDNNNNAFRGGAGTDAFFGGGGIDTADYSGATAGIAVDLAVGLVGIDGQGGRDNLFSIEHIVGSAFADTIWGDTNANQIEGGAGNDNMVGGGGADAFVFRSGSNIDNIFDFLKVQGDKIHLQSNLNGSGITTAAQALAATADVGVGNAAVFLGGLNAVTLVGVSTASLAASDFVIF